MKKLLISLLVAGGLIGAVFGAANSLVVQGVDDLGGSSDPVAIPGGSTVTISEVGYNLESDDISLVDSVTLDVTVTASEETCTIDVQLTASGGATLGSPQQMSATYPVGTTTDTTGTGMSALAEDVTDVEITIRCDN